MPEDDTPDCDDYLLDLAIADGHDAATYVAALMSAALREFAEARQHAPNPAERARGEAAASIAVAIDGEGMLLAADHLAMIAAALHDFGETRLGDEDDDQFNTAIHALRFAREIRTNLAAREAAA